MNRYVFNVEKLDRKNEALKTRQFIARDDNLTINFKDLVTKLLEAVVAEVALSATLLTSSSRFESCLRGLEFIL